MPKQKNLNQIIPVRVDASTCTNLDQIIAAGFAADNSAAFRASVAIAAWLLSGDPRVFVISPGVGSRRRRKSKAVRWRLASSL